MPSTTTLCSPSFARRFAAGVVACGLLLASACSSDSEPSAEPGDADVADVSDVSDGNDASEEGSSGGSGSSDSESTASEEVATAPVCDLITPVLDDLVEAFGTDLPMTEDSPNASLQSGCTIDLMEPFDESGGERRSVIIEVARYPALYTDVAETVERNEFGGSSSEVDSVGGDAMIQTDGVGEAAMVFFSSGGRVWSVKATWSYVGPPDGHDLEESITEVAGVVRAGLEATGSGS